MKSIWITIIVMICVTSCFSQDYKTWYENIKKSSFNIPIKTGTLPTDTSSINKYIFSIENNKNAGGINGQQWNIIFSGWQQFKKRLKTYQKIDAYEKNDADDERIEEHWHDFKNLINRSEGQLFASNDNTLIQAIGKVETLVKDSSTKLIREATALRCTVVNESNEVKKIIQDTVVKNQKKLFYDIDSIKYFLYKRDTIKNSINLHGYDRNVYGLSYLKVFNPIKKSALNAFAALAEIITSFHSFKLRNTGAFLSAGVQHRSMVLLAGLGYFDNQEAYNISWKTSFIYFPHQSRFGFGASYSPLTKAGIIVGFKLN